MLNIYKNFKKLMKKIIRKVKKESKSYVSKLRFRIMPTEISDQDFLTDLIGYNTELSKILEHFKNRTVPEFFIDLKQKNELVKLEDLINKYVIIKEAEKICSHLFSFLGSQDIKLTEKIDWHYDFKTEKRWPLKYFAEIDYMNLDEPSDVKIPWELNRCQQFVTLGKAYWLKSFEDPEEAEKYSREFIEELESWIDANPPERGINWINSMEVGIRAVNWVWAWYFFKDSPIFTDEIKIKFFKSLLWHGKHILRNLEYYEELNSNHLLSDGVGLLYLGILFPEFKEAQKWKNKGLEIVFGEIEKQVYTDGVDYEKSISYHRLVIDILVHSVILCKLNNIKIPQTVLNRLEKMIEFIMYYTKPDGTVPLIGDADDGRLVKLEKQEVNGHRAHLSTGAVLFNRPDFKKFAGKFYEESFWLLGKEGFYKFNESPEYPKQLSTKSFPEGGFYVMHENDLFMFIDCGDVGMKGNGGHGHNDALSFELYAGDKTFITDSGCFCYTASPYWHFYFKSTRAHNTMVVDGEEKSEWFSG